MRKLRLLVLLLALSGAAAQAAEDVADLQKEWAHITYELEGDVRAPALEALSEVAAALVAEHPGEADLLIWQGIILSSYAGEAGGLGALSAAKRARASLEHALDFDHRALEGSAYTSLGALYYKVPGWPIGFGSDKKARAYLEQAIELNPDGIDPNYFMGEFLLEDGNYEQAARYLERALAAPERANRPVADAGRREEVRALLSRIPAV